MWLKIILAIVGIIVIGFIGMVIKMAVTDAKEETRDIEEASKKKLKSNSQWGLLLIEMAVCSMLMRGRDKKSVAEMPRIFLYWEFGMGYGSAPCL